MPTFRIRHFMAKITAITAIAATALCFFAQPSRADVWTRSWDPHASIIETTYKSLPQAFRPSNDSFLAEDIDDDGFQKAQKKIFADEKPTKVIGLYLSSINDCAEHPRLSKLPMILIGVKLADKDVPHVFVHEYGHHIYFRLLTEEERTDFTNLFVEAETANTLPTAYAHVNVLEGFAECFEYYIDHVNNMEPSLAVWFDQLKDRLSQTEKARVANTAKSAIVPKP